MVASFSARAARIAPTYARHLEQEEGCNPEFAAGLLLDGSGRPSPANKSKLRPGLHPMIPLLAALPHHCQRHCGSAETKLAKAFLAIPGGHLRMALFYALPRASRRLDASSRKPPQTEEIVEANISGSALGLRPHGDALNNLIFDK